MRLEVDLSNSDAEALLRHLESFQPASGDYRDDARLREAMQVIQEALREALEARD